MGTATTYVAPRTCTVVGEGEPTRATKKPGKPLTNYADAAAYVLIAEAGAGKSTAFETEAIRQGGSCVTVRDFLTYDDKPDWHGTTLFLDGLDESRAGIQDGRTPLDDIRRKLDRLERPRFRLSCRWADWMAANDREALNGVSSDGFVTVMRLDPLSEGNIKAILANNHGVKDTAGFIATARERGVYRLLSNPQNLKMLAESVSGGKWPDSRRETFEQACRTLVRELNGQHLVARPSSAETASLIDAAGRLCTAQLFSGVAGYTLPDRAVPDGEHPSLAEVDGEAGGRARDVMGTRLFVGTLEGKLAPAHRQIAEFLAARHVSRLVDKGLPLERILALITGFDGELMPSFANFASWLAVHSKRSRTRLSRLNPSGMIYAADRGTYSADEKRDILLNLRRESAWNAWCTRGVSKVAGIGGIVGPELEGTFRGILSEAERGHEHQSYVMLLMQMLADGEALPALSDVVEKTVRDPMWSQGVRCAALDVLTGYCAQGRLAPGTLVGMLAEIDNGSLEDPQDELLGILLKDLYPKVLSIAEVQRYLRKPKFVETTGEYTKFWTEHVPRESTPDQLAELLDGIAQRFTEYRPFMVGDVGLYTRLGRLPVELLDRVLSAARRELVSVAEDRLYEWLGVVSDPDLRLPKQDKTGIRFDLQWDADTLTALIAYGVETCLRRGEECAGLVDRRLFGARPSRYAPWCVERALAAGDRRAASFYVRELVDCLTNGTRTWGMTVEDARVGLAEDESLVSLFDEMQDGGAGPENQAKRLTTSAAADTAEQKAGQALTAAQASTLRAGRGSPQLLGHAAETYLGIQEESPTASRPRDRLRRLVGAREDLIDLLASGMEGTITRSDLPSCADVVRLFDKRRVDWLVLSFAAGMHSLEQSGRLVAADLNESQARLAVTILYTLPRECVDPNHAGQTGLYRPEWFRVILRDNPALVADVLRGSAARKLETGLQQATELQTLATAEDHREVAELVSLSVLEHFPKAETDATLRALCWSLKAVLERCDWSEVGRVIEERLGRSDLATKERGCWLAAGYLVAPGRFREDLRRLAEYDDGLKWMTMLMDTGGSPEDLTQRFAPDDFEPLVAAMGAACKRVGLTKRAYWSTTDLITRLGADPGSAATEALEELSRVTDAEPWAPAIADAREHQARKRREQEYHHSDIGKVVQTLDRGTPANAGDLAAVTFDELKDLASKIRDGSTSDWRQYWNRDHHSRPTDPHPEDACRDTLLSDLQDRLARLGIDAQREGVYAEDKRSDIRVSFAGFNVPVEIKRSCHPDLWTAVRSQLISKYTRDPGAAGHGIYLVFWFGDTEKCRPRKCGAWTPETAEDVRLRLQQSLADREGRLISVCVVDVSKPDRSEQ